MRLSMDVKTVTISLRDAETLGISWSDICEVTGGNVYAIKEGLLRDDDMIKVPISLIK